MHIDVNLDGRGWVCCCSTFNSQKWKWWRSCLKSLPLNLDLKWREVGRVDRAGTRKVYHQNIIYFSPSPPNIITPHHRLGSQKRPHSAGSLYCFIFLFHPATYFHKVSDWQLKGLDFKQECHHFLFWLLKVEQQQPHPFPSRLTSICTCIYYIISLSGSVVKPPTVKLLTVKTSLFGGFYW